MVLHVVGETGDGGEAEVVGDLLQGQRREMQKKVVPALYCTGTTRISIIDKSCVLPYEELLAVYHIEATLHGALLHAAALQVVDGTIHSFIIR